MIRRKVFDAVVRFADRFAPARLMDHTPGFRGALIRSGPARGLRFDAGPSNPAYALGSNELPVQNALLEYVRPGGVLYDVGANVGYFSVIGGRDLRPSGRVYAFEPVPANAMWIRRNARLNRLRNIVVLEAAASDTSGRSELLVTRYSGGSVLASADHRAPDVERRITVETIAVDDLVFSRRLPAPTVVKIDVEGAELQVLRGMIRTLRQIRPIVIYEIDDVSQDRYERKQQACDDLLHTAGYVTRQLPDSYSGSRWIVRHTVATPSG